jgi:anthranilate synthase component I
VQRVSVALPADLDTPVSAYAKLAHGQTHTFLFESVEGGERVGRYSFLGIEPREVRSFSREGAADSLAFVDAFVRSRMVLEPDDAPGFAGGLVGFAGFESVGRVEPRLRTSAPDELGFPEATWMDFDTVVVFDNLRHTLTVVGEIRARTLAELDRAYAAAARRIAHLVERLEGPVPRLHTTSGALGPLVARTSRAEFLRAVQRAKTHIRGGDCQQIVLSQRFDRAGDIDPFGAYRALRSINPSPYLFLLTLGDRALVGSSPETLVRVSGARGEEREVVVHPIAGTRRRGATPALDRALEGELLADEKENAEHVMLLDLGRNDVGRVARVGTVQIARDRVVERYSHVMHLVSEVRGQLRADCTEIDALRAAFPAGTVSGSPKIRAIELIQTLEPCPRGPYAGAVGYVGSNGELDLAIAIRTLLITKGRVSVQAGAGVVADSSPTAEFAETVHKASALLQTVERAVEGSGGRRG